MNKSNEIKNLYRSYLRDLVTKHLWIKLTIASVITGYFMFSDLYFRNSLPAFYTRLLPFGFEVILAIILLFFKNQQKLKVIFYHLILASLPVMMFAKFIIHFNDSLSLSFSGIIVAVFPLTLDAKTSTRNAVFIFFLPLIIFVIILFSFFNSGNEYIIIPNLITVYIFGFTTNIIQNKLRFENFEKTQELILNEKRLKESNTTKDKFFSIIAHDLKGPIGSMMQLSILMTENKNEKIFNNKLLGFQKELSKNTYQLLENLLNWAKLNDESIKIKRQLINLKEIIAHSVVSLKLMAQQKNISIIDNDIKACNVFADKDMLDFIVRNLLTNAVKFTRNGGEIRIESEHVNKFTMIKVSDNGIGIPEESIKQILEGNEYFSTIGTNKEKGTGLGLKLCKSFIDQNKGVFEINSTVGKGSEFIIKIPEVVDN